MRGGFDLEDGRWTRVIVGLFGVWACWGLGGKGIRAIVNEATTGHKGRGVILGEDAVIYGGILLTFGLLLGLVGVGCLYMAYKEEGH
jgi:hypothetical protein